LFFYQAGNNDQLFRQKIYHRQNNMIVFGWFSVTKMLLTTGGYVQLKRPRIVEPPATIWTLIGIILRHINLNDYLFGFGSGCHWWGNNLWVKGVTVHATWIVIPLLALCISKRLVHNHSGWYALVSSNCIISNYRIIRKWMIIRKLILKRN
jgi:hypothetical protein